MRHLWRLRQASVHPYFVMEDQVARSTLLRAMRLQEPNQYNRGQIQGQTSEVGSGDGDGKSTSTQGEAGGKGKGRKRPREGEGEDDGVESVDNLLNPLGPESTDPYPPPSMHDVDRFAHPAFDRRVKCYYFQANVILNPKCDP